MDEASQVDIKTGALALSCAMNAVIVGDSKQLPNVVSQADALAYGAVRANYAVGDCYDAVKCSFLQSCIEVFREAPMTLLREHYRCHPKIIGFCNQRFYDGALLAMTTDEGESKVLQVVRTVEGNHARGHFNQREIDVLSCKKCCPNTWAKGVWASSRLIVIKRRRSTGLWGRSWPVRCTSTKGESATRSS